MEKLNSKALSSASIIMGAGDSEVLKIKGTYKLTCVGADGKLRWEDEIKNVVCTIGKNLMLDTVLAGSAYTVTGPYMGLISSASFSAVAAGDTQASHSGWTEAGSTNAPTFAARLITAWSAASAGAKALSASCSFAMTGAGTLKGCFIVFGSGAVATLMSTAGTLLSAGAFSGGDRAVLSGDTVNVSYSLAL
jgi:hypothetical protein